MINKKRSAKYIKMLILIGIIILLIFAIQKILGRYRSKGESSVNAEIAFYAVKDTYQTGNIFLNHLYPRENPYTYTFTVSNIEEEHVAEVKISYEIFMNITTNLPLEFKIYKNDTLLTNEEEISHILELDEENENYIRKINIKNGILNHSEIQTDTYKIEVLFPQKYNQNEEFEGVIDNIDIEFNSKQILENE